MAQRRRFAATAVRRRRTWIRNFSSIAFDAPETLTHVVGLLGGFLTSGGLLSVPGVTVGAIHLEMACKNGSEAPTPNIPQVAVWGVRKANVSEDPEELSTIGTGGTDFFRSQDWMGYGLVQLQDQGQAIERFHIRAMRKLEDPPDNLVFSIQLPAEMLVGSWNFRLLSSVLLLMP